MAQQSGVIASLVGYDSIVFFVCRTTYSAVSGHFQKQIDLHIW